MDREIFLFIYFFSYERVEMIEYPSFCGRDEIFRRRLCAHRKLTRALQKTPNSSCCIIMAAHSLCDIVMARDNVGRTGDERKEIKSRVYFLFIFFFEKPRKRVGGMWLQQNKKRRKEQRAGRPGEMCEANENNVFTDTSDARIGKIKKEDFC